MPTAVPMNNDESVGLLKDDASKLKSMRSFEEYHFDYEAFIARMREPSCRPIIVQVRRFLKEFESFSIGEQPHLFRRFHQRVWEKLMLTEAWRQSSASETVNAREGLEYLLMNQLYDKAYRHSQDDAEANEQLVIKLKSFSWLQPRHLQCHESKVPKITDKMELLIKGCAQIQTSSDDKAEPAETTNADDLLPRLILAIIRASPEHLMMDLAYIQRFRDPQQLKSANGYLLTNCLAACQFIRSLKTEELQFETPEEEQKRKEFVKSILREPTSARSSPSNGYTRSPSLEFSKLEERANRMIGSIKQSNTVKSLKKFFGEAEAAIRESIDTVLESSGDEDEEAVVARAAKEVDHAKLTEEEEFQLQLTMALSLSEQDLLGIQSSSALTSNRLDSWACTRDVI